MKDDASTTASYSEDTAITSFTLGSVTVTRHVGKKKYAKDPVTNEPLDSFYTYKYTGSNTPVYIDQVCLDENGNRIGEIYNTDSLPAGSHMKMLATVVAKNSSTINYCDWDAREKPTSEAGWVRYSSSDSIVFGTDNAASKELCFRVFATQGGYTRDYKVKIVNHLEFADSFKYVPLTPQAIFADATSLKGAYISEGIYVLAAKNGESKLYVSSDFASTWNNVAISYLEDGNEKKVESFGGAATIASADDRLYVLDGNTLYYTDDGKTWQKADVAGYNLKTIVGGCNEELYAMNASGGIMVAKTSKLASWEIDQLFDNAHPLPTKDISSSAFVQRANTKVSRITMIGNKENYTGTDTLAVIWNKNVNETEPEVWVYNDPTDAAAKKHGLPALGNLSTTGYYNGWILAIGGTALNGQTSVTACEKIYCSEDGGISWHILKGLKMPFETVNHSVPMLIVADAEGYFYLITADGGKMFRCKLNNATWAPTDYIEYKAKGNS